MQKVVVSGMESKNNEVPQWHILVNAFNAYYVLPLCDRKPVLGLNFELGQFLMRCCEAKTNFVHIKVSFLSQLSHQTLCLPYNCCITWQLRCHIS